MKRLGYYLHRSPDRYLIVKIANPKRIPKLYVKVYDSSMNFIGYLIDIIGPITSPYAVIKPVKKEEPKPHEMLYVAR